MIIFLHRPDKNYFLVLDFIVITLSFFLYYFFPSHYFFMAEVIDLKFCIRAVRAEAFFKYLQLT